MTKYKRFTGKVFGGNATATGDDPQISQFGSALAGTFAGTTDPEEIQNLPAWGQGWIGAVTPNTQFPALSEMTGAMKVLSHQICGILQQGISDWDNGTIYYQNNFASKNGKIYISLTNENQGNDPETDIVNWKDFIDIDIDYIEQQLANKADINTPSIQAPYLKTSYASGTSGYVIWSNGYCIQWGAVLGTTSVQGDKTITFAKTFKDKSFNFTFSYSNDKNSTSMNDSGYEVYTSRTNNSTIVHSTTNIHGYSWNVCGYLASGQY